MVHNGPNGCHPEARSPSTRLGIVRGMVSLLSKAEGSRFFVELRSSQNGTIRESILISRNNIFPAKIILIWKYMIMSLSLKRVIGGALAIAVLWGGEFAGGAAALEEAQRVLGFDEYFRLATQNDTEFEEILIDELELKYQKALRLPAKDLVVSVKQQHEFFINADRDSPDTTVGLTKLFPSTGTEVTVDYEVGASPSSADESSEASFTFAQPIAQNAFGRSTRLLDKIVGLEVDVASYQVTEAYEDYLAAIITAYYTWQEDYENLLIGRSSYTENLKLLDNMSERQNQKVALPIDVNKVKLQVLAKKESLIALEEQYQNSLNVIERVIRYRDGPPLVPVEPRDEGAIDGAFDESFRDFTEHSRTFAILRKLEEQSALRVARDADDLFPSIQLIGGYTVSGEEYPLNNEEAFYYAGAKLDWPLFDQVDRAELEISKIREDKAKLSTVNAYQRLYTQLRNLYLRVAREKELKASAEEKIVLARAVLADEQENYSYGKVTLNDYIQAVNTLDNNRFNKITHDALYRKLIVEWKRLTDRLIGRKALRPQIERLEKKRKDG